MKSTISLHIAEPYASFPSDVRPPATAQNLSQRGAFPRHTLRVIGLSLTMGKHEWPDVDLLVEDRLPGHVEDSDVGVEIYHHCVTEQEDETERLRFVDSCLASSRLLTPFCISLRLFMSPHAPSFLPTPSRPSLLLVAPIHASPRLPTSRRAPPPRVPPRLPALPHALPRPPAPLRASSRPLTPRCAPRCLDAPRCAPRCLDVPLRSSLRLLAPPQLPLIVPLRVPSRVPLPLHAPSRPAAPRRAPHASPRFPAPRSRLLARPSSCARDTIS
ncbi:hypothetical protein EDB86DRAFT_3079419 [Lactarius hatsudake]|nr:hypothetical protein EDB86DRAFT_3079419 [Lactarius hatsudake]